jgi:hypothetical protein
MKEKMEKSVFYTAAEVVEIMKQAKALGFTSITVPGLSAHALDVQSGPGEAPAAQPQQTPADERPPVATQVRYLPPVRESERREAAIGEAWRKDRFCRVCNSQMTLGNYGKFYCQPCYIDRKERSRH